MLAVYPAVRIGTRAGAQMRLRTAEEAPADVATALRDLLAR
jgi:hypothetical protein